MESMLKLIGALMLIGGSVVIGLRAMERLSERVSVYAALIHAIQIMQAEITFRLTPLTELMKLLGGQIEAPVNQLFEHCYHGLCKNESGVFSAVWDNSLRQTIGPELSLEARQNLRELGGVLGRYDAETQAKALAHMSVRMEYFLESAKREKERQSKVYGVLGLVSGLAAVIVLI